METLKIQKIIALSLLFAALSPRLTVITQSRARCESSRYSIHDRIEVDIDLNCSGGKLFVCDILFDPEKVAQFSGRS